MIIAIIKKELLQLRRDPRLMGLIVVMPLLMLFLFGTALKLQPENVKMAYLDEDHSFFSDLIKTSLYMEGYFDMYPVDSEQGIVDAIRAGKAKAGMVIGPDFTKDITENRQPHIQLYVDGSMPSLATAMKYNSSPATDDEVTQDMYFLDADADNIIIAEDPFVMDTIVLFNPDEKETWFFLPGVIGILIMQIALILTGICIVREKEKGTLEQLLVTPLTKTAFIFGKLTPYVFIALADFYFILGVGWAIFDLPQPTSHLLLFAVALIFVAAMISLGLVISLVSQTQQQAMFISIFIIVPSILLSGFIFPLEAIPDTVRFISYLIPFTYFIDIIRGLLIKKTLLADLWISYLVLCGFVVAFIGLSIAKFRNNI